MQAPSFNYYMVEHVLFTMDPSTPDLNWCRKCSENWREGIIKQQQ